MYSWILSSRESICRFIEPFQKIIKSRAAQKIRYHRKTGPNRAVQIGLYLIGSVNGLGIIKIAYIGSVNGLDTIKTA